MTAGATAGCIAAPRDYAEALAMGSAALDFLCAGAGEVPEAALGDVLLRLEAAGGRLAAARAALLARFDAAGTHDADGYQNSSSWLRDRGGLTHAVAKKRVRQSRVLRDRPLLAAAMLAGTLSESWADKLVVMTRPVSEDLRDYADEMVLKVLDAGGDLDDAARVIAKILECAAPQPDPDDPDGPGPDGGDDGFSDRSLRLETTLGGAGVLHADLTPEATAAVQAVIDALGKKNGAQDTRTKLQRDHDALKDAADRLLGSRLLPDRAGSTTRAEVRISFADLSGMPGAGTLTEAWLTGTLAEPGWLAGPAADAVTCDALVSPVVTAAPDWDIAGEIVFLVIDALGRHGLLRAGQPVGPGPGPDPDPDPGPGFGPDTRGSESGGCGTGRGDGSHPDAPDADGGERPSAPPSVPLPAEAWSALLYAVGKLAVKFVSGPGSIASLLRTGLLDRPFTGKSVPLDVGISSQVPDSIRRAVIARAGGRCEWPGGCDVPASACDVHHLKHRKDGGPTSVQMCTLLCNFHHDVCVHRWSWTLDLQADGTLTATSPDGTQTLHGHPRRGPAVPRPGPPSDDLLLDSRPPPVPVA